MLAGLKLQGQIGKFGRVDLSDITAFAELPDGKVVSGCEAGWLLLWEGGAIKTQIGRLEATSSRASAEGYVEGSATHGAHDAPVHFVSLDRRAGALITGGDDGVIRWWDWGKIDAADALTDGFSIPGHSPICTASIDAAVRVRGMVMISEADQPLVDGDDAAAVRRLVTWLVQDGRGNVWKLVASVVGVRGSGVPSDGPSHLGSVHAMEVVSIEPVFTGNAGAVAGVACSPLPSEPFAASIGTDGSIRCWNTTTSQMVLATRFTHSAGPGADRTHNGDSHQLHGTALAWAPSSVDPTGRTVAAGFSDGTVRVLYRGGDEWKRIAVLKPASAPVTAVSYSSDGSRLAVSSADGCVFLFAITPKTGGSAVEAAGAPAPIKPLVSNGYQPLGFVRMLAATGAVASSSDVDGAGSPSPAAAIGGTTAGAAAEETPAVPAHCLSWSSDNSTLAVGCADSGIRLLSIPPSSSAAGATWPDTDKSFDLTATGFIAVSTVELEVEIRKAAPPPPVTDGDASKGKDASGEGAKKKRRAGDAAGDDASSPAAAAWPTEITERGKPGPITSLVFHPSSAGTAGAGAPPSLLVGCSGDGGHLLHDLQVPKSLKPGQWKGVKPTSLYPIAPLLSGENVRRPHVTCITRSQPSSSSSAAAGSDLVAVGLSNGSVVLKSASHLAAFMRIVVTDGDAGGVSSAAFAADGGSIAVAGGDGSVTVLTLASPADTTSALAAHVSDASAMSMTAYGPVDVREAWPVGPQLQQAPAAGGAADASSSAASTTTAAADGTAPQQAPPTDAVAADAFEAASLAASIAAAAAALEAASKPSPFLPLLPADGCTTPTIFPSTRPQSASGSPTSASSSAASASVASTDPVDIWLASHAPADVFTDPSTYSIQEDRLKSAAEARRRDAEGEKEKMRRAIANLREAYSQLRQRSADESAVHPSRGLSEDELTLDPELVALLRAEGEERLAEVDRECTYERQLRRVHLSKLVRTFLLELEPGSVGVSVTPIQPSDELAAEPVATLRTASLPPWLADAIAAASGDAEGGIRGSRHGSRPGTGAGEGGGRPRSVLRSGRPGTVAGFPSSSSPAGSVGTTQKVDLQLLPSPASSSSPFSGSGSAVSASGAAAGAEGKQQEAGDAAGGDAAGSVDAGVPAVEGAEEISFEHRKELRNQRRLALKALEAQRPGPDDEDPADVAAVSWATDHMGDHTLKTDKNYKVPEGVKLDAPTKRREILLAEGRLHSLRTDFNDRVATAVTRKRAVIASLVEMEAELSAIDAELSEGITARILAAAGDDITTLLASFPCLQTPIVTSFVLPDLASCVAPNEQQGWESLTSLAARHVTDAVAEARWDLHLRNVASNAASTPGHANSSDMFAAAKSSYSGVMSRFLGKLHSHDNGEKADAAAAAPSSAPSSRPSSSSLPTSAASQPAIAAGANPDPHALVVAPYAALPSSTAAAGLWRFDLATAHAAPITASFPGQTNQLVIALPLSFAPLSPPSQEEVDAAYTAVTALAHRKATLRANQTALVQGFDSIVASLRRERLAIQNECVAGNLRLGTMRQELALLSDMAKRDSALDARLSKARADKAAITASVAGFNATIAEKKADLEVLLMKERALMSEFEEISGSASGGHGGVSPPVYAQLLKIYRRKIKRSKASSGGAGDGKEGENGEEEEEDDLDDLEGLDEDDDDEDEETCPDGCEKASYEKILALRNRRLDVVDAADEINKVIDEARKAADRATQRERQTDRDLASINNEMAIFQREKQGKLNQIATWAVLKASQIVVGKQAPGCVMPSPLQGAAAPPATPASTAVQGPDDSNHAVGQLPSSIDHCVLFTRSSLRALRSRIGELESENKQLVAQARSLTKQERKLAADKKVIEAEIAATRTAITELQTLKFGRTIDVDALDRATGNTTSTLAAVQAQQAALEAASAVELEAGRKRLVALQQDLTNLTRQHTALLETIATLQARLAALEGELSGRPETGLAAVALHSTMGTGVATAVASGKLGVTSLAALQPIIAKGAAAKRGGSTAGASDSLNSTAFVTAGVTLNSSKGAGGVSVRDESAAAAQDALERRRLAELVSSQAAVLESLRAEIAVLKMKGAGPEAAAAALASTTISSKAMGGAAMARKPPHAPGAAAAGLPGLALTGTTATLGLAAKATLHHATVGQQTPFLSLKKSGSNSHS